MHASRHGINSCIHPGKINYIFFYAGKQLLSVFLSGEHQLLVAGKNTKLYSYLSKVGNYFVCLHHSHVQKYVAYPQVPTEKSPMLKSSFLLVKCQM